MAVTLFEVRMFQSFIEIFELCFNGGFYRWREKMSGTLQSETVFCVLLYAERVVKWAVGNVSAP